MKSFYLLYLFLVSVFSYFILTNNSYGADFNYEINTINAISISISTNNKENNITDKNKNHDTTEAIMTKSPSGAIWRSLVIPGWGQIYVENYWKVPIFTASAGTLWYFVIDNTIKYNDYKEKLASANPNSPEFNILKNKRNNAVDTRDLSALYLLGVYLIATVDAYVGAHLFDFSVSNNLQLYLSPITMPPTNNNYINNYIKLNITWRF